MSRLRTLHALAWSLPDVAPAPSSAKSGASRGEVPNAWHLCESCDGQGFGRDKFGRALPCLRCSGDGRFRVDSMTGERVASLDSVAPPRTRRVLCDRCGGDGVWKQRRCEMCDGAGKVSVPAVLSEPVSRAFDGTARSRLRARGDWEKLEGVLDWLRSEDVRYWRLWVAVRVSGAPVDGNEVLLAALDGWLLEALPDPLRCPRDVVTAFEHRTERADAREAARRAKGGRGGGRKREKARELLRMGYDVAEAARLAGCSVKTARRAAAA